MPVQCDISDDECNLVARQVEGEQDDLQAVLLLHLVVLVGHLHVELAQLCHGAVGLSGNILKGER